MPEAKQELGIKLVAAPTPLARKRIFSAVANNVYRTMDAEKTRTPPHMRHVSNDIH